MARSNGSLMDLIVGWSAKLPWWFSIGLALLVYLGLDLIPNSPTETSSSIQDMGGVVIKQMLIAVAKISQYILPLLLVLGALISVFSGYKGKKLYSRLTDNPSLQTLNDISWIQFELLVGQFFQQQGYRVKQSAHAGSDEGIDLVVFKDTDKYLVQCKQWRANKVGVKVVRELLGAIAAKGAVGGFVVTSGAFAQSASDFAQGRNIELIDGLEIVQRVSLDSLDDADVQAMPAGCDLAKPSCPNCHKLMVIRTARQGKNKGNQFWGCGDYPKCHGTRQLL